MPSVLKWLSTKLNCTSQVAGLLAATSASDVEVVRGIIRENPDLGLYNTQGSLVGGRSALTIAAERGDLEILRIIYEGAIKAKGEAFAKQSLNSGGERGQTPLMRACTFAGSSQHIKCVKYLLTMGADPFTETDKGETCLHLAAKNAYTECLTEIVTAEVSVGGHAAVRLADAVLPYTPPIRFVEMRNAAGFTALHLATLKNSPACMQVLLGAGASMDAGILDAGNTPHLARGSTALHIAAARGSVACCNVLLDFELAHPDMDIRRIRNERNLKASQLARLAGHDELALMLRALPRNSSRSPQQDRSQGTRRRRRRSTRENAARETRHESSRPSISPEAVMDVLVARTQLLLALRDVGLELGIRELPKEGLASVQAAHPMPNPDEPSASGKARDEVAQAVAIFTDLWQKGKLEERENGGFLTSMVPADLQVAKLPDSILGSSESGTDSYSAAALIQAALNAMAHFSQSAKPLDLPPTNLKPTSFLAAAVVVQVAIKKLAGKGSNLNTTNAASLINSIHTTQAISPLAGKGHSLNPRSEERRRRNSSSSQAGRAKPEDMNRIPEGVRMASPEEACCVHVAACTIGAQNQQILQPPESQGKEQQIVSSPDSVTDKQSSIQNSPADDAPLSNTDETPAVELSNDEDAGEMPMWEGYDPSGLDSDSNAMTMWEGYEFGSQDPAGQSAKPSSFQPHSPPRKIPSSRSDGRTEWTDGSLSSTVSLQKSAEPGPQIPIRPPLKVLMDRKSSVGSAGPMSPSEDSSYAAPFNGQILSTEQTGYSETEKDEDGGTGTDEDDLDGADRELKCAICMDQPLHCAVSPCLHKICYGCAYQLCSRGLNIPICPFCRGHISMFISSERADQLSDTV